MTTSARLDHVAINVGTDIDRAAALFAALGFTMTPRGYHSHGSVNHLMLFAHDYLELIAVPEGAAIERQDLRDAPIGINGIVFATSDVDAVFARLDGLGFDGEPPRAFHRPVTHNGGTADARFRTVTVRSGVFPGGRVYFCHHLTPELVWQPEWLGHDNHVSSIAGVVVVSDRPEAEAGRFAALLDADLTGSPESPVVELDGSRLTVVSPEAYRARFPDMASPMGERNSIFGAIELTTTDPSSLDRALGRIEENDDHIQTRRLDDRRIVRVGPYETVLEIVTRPGS